MLEHVIGKADMRVLVESIRYEQLPKTYLGINLALRGKCNQKVRKQGKGITAAFLNTFYHREFPLFCLGCDCNQGIADTQPANAAQFLRSAGAERDRRV